MDAIGKVAMEAVLNGKNFYEDTANNIISIKWDSGTSQWVFSVGGNEFAYTNSNDFGVKPPKSGWTTGLASCSGSPAPTLTGDIVDGSSIAVSVENIVTPVTENLKIALTYRFTRTGDNSSPLEVNFAITGTALPDDFGIAAGANCIIYNSTAKTGTITMPLGSNTVDLLVFPIGDSMIEDDETVIVSVANPQQPQTVIPATSFRQIFSSQV